MLEQTENLSQERPKLAIHNHTLKLFRYRFTNPYWAFLQLSSTERTPCVLTRQRKTHAATVQRDNLMRDLYVGHDQQIVMLDAVLGVPDCEIEDLLGETIILPVLNKMLSSPLVIITADRAKGGVVDHIKAAAARLGVSLPDGWKPETARIIATEWSLKNPAELPAVVLDRAATLFGEINKRF